AHALELRDSLQSQADFKPHAPCGKFLGRTSEVSRKASPLGCSGQREKVQYCSTDGAFGSALYLRITKIMMRVIVSRNQLLRLMAPLRRLTRCDLPWSNRSVNFTVAWQTIFNQPSIPTFRDEFNRRSTMKSVRPSLIVIAACSLLIGSV